MRTQVDERYHAYGRCQSHRAVDRDENPRGLATVGPQIAVQNMARWEGGDAIVPGELNVEAEREREQKHRQDEKF